MQMNITAANINFTMGDAVLQYKNLNYVKEVLKNEI